MGSMRKDAPTVEDIVDTSIGRPEYRIKFALEEEDDKKALHCTSSDVLRLWGHFS
jgi:hypothetical protein